MAAQEMEQQNCRVEVSGWDLDENFFVEKTNLCQRDDGNQGILLNTPLRVGSLVFVRMAEETSAGRAMPVTYCVASVDPKPSGGKLAIRLSQLHPRKAVPRTITEFAFHGLAKN